MIDTEVGKLFGDRWRSSPRNSVLSVENQCLNKWVRKLVNNTPDDLK